MNMVVTSTVVEGLFAEARAADPRECCGLLFGDPDVITGYAPTANVHPSPETHFEIDPRALIDAHRAMRESGRRLVGYYHSHPRGRPEPSVTDRAMAAGDGMIWAIVAASEMRLWRATDRGFGALSYTAI